MPELNAALTTLQSTKARGMDAVTNCERKYMCDDLKKMLLDFLNLVSETATWPKALTRARMYLIKK